VLEGDLIVLIYENLCIKKAARLTDKAYLTDEYAAA